MAGGTSKRERSKAVENDNKKFKKWNTLRHHGPRFPPVQRIPHSLFKYNGKVLQLSEATAEIAIAYTNYLIRMNKENKTVKKPLKENFFKTWRDIMTTDEKETIAHLSKCNFTGIKNYLMKRSIEEKNKSREQKRLEKEEREREAKPYRTVIIDGRIEEIANFLVEPPGLFLGRGANRNIGKVKRRIQPEDVILNCDEEPRPPTGHHWKRTVQEKDATWLAKWDDPITGKPKYIQLSTSSREKQTSDQLKYEKAQELEEKIEIVRGKYMRHLTTGSLENRQHATALCLIDKFAFRIGNEKSLEEAQTAGCCTLLKKHVQLRKNRRIKFNFKGKDSIREDREVIVPLSVFRNLYEFCQGKGDNRLIFDEITTQSLNNYLGSLMKGLTAKVFRTFRATTCFSNHIQIFMKPLGPNSDLKRKMIAFNRANLEVAKLLNHRKLKNNNAASGKQILKLKKKIKDMENQLPGSQQKNKLENDLTSKREELDLKENLDNYALQTSKLNYINPKVVLKWCEENQVPRNKVYSKVQLKKFQWAVKTLWPVKEEKESEIEERLWPQELLTVSTFSLNINIPMEE